MPTQARAHLLLQRHWVQLVQVLLLLRPLRPLAALGGGRLLLHQALACRRDGVHTGASDEVKRGGTGRGGRRDSVPLSQLEPKTNRVPHSASATAAACDPHSAAPTSKHVFVVVVRRLGAPLAAPLLLHLREWTQQSSRQLREADAKQQQAARAVPLLHKQTGVRQWIQVLRSSGDQCNGATARQQRKAAELTVGKSRFAQAAPVVNATGHCTWLCKRGKTAKARGAELGTGSTAHLVVHAKAGARLDVLLVEGAGEGGLDLAGGGVGWMVGGLRSGWTQATKRRYTNLQVAHGRGQASTHAQDQRPQRTQRAQQPQRAHLRFHGLHGVLAPGALGLELGHVWGQADQGSKMTSSEPCAAARGVLAGARHSPDER